MRETIGTFLLAHWPWALLWVAAVSVVAFAMMGTDKRRAKRGDWRIPEKSLFLAAILGGSPGSILGMAAFHHKTRHWYFKVGMPAILIAQIALVVWLLLPPELP